MYIYQLQKVNMKEKLYTHLFYDLDHTLWDFETNSVVTLKNIYKEFELSYKGMENREEFIKAYQQINIDMWGQFERGEITRSELRVGRFFKLISSYQLPDFNFATALADAYLHQLPEQKALFEGAIDLLQYLQNKGYHMHLITNGFTTVQEHKIKNSGISHFFTHLITSEMVNANKPNKEIFEYALRKSGAQVNESVMIGDSPYADMVGASRVGMDRILFNTNALPLEIDVTHEIKSLTELKKIL
jgi:putative hydrolase of the HAD superfamily